MINLNVSKTLGIAAQGSIMIWRIMLCAISFNPARFAREFDTFKIVNPRILFEYDSSLTGMGLRISELIYSNNDSSKFAKRLIGVDSLKFRFNLAGDSSYQNTCEFLAVVTGLVILAQLGWRNVSIKLVGDSITSNKWSLEERYKGLASQRASFVFTIVSTLCHYWVIESEWLSSESNGEMDSLSRGLVNPIVDWGLSDNEVLDLENNKSVHEMVDICNPSLPVMSWNETIRLWSLIIQWIGWTLNNF
jgi:hypothetical protein